MGFIELKPKSVSQRNYFGNFKSRAVTSISNTVSNIVTTTNEYLARARRAILELVRRWITTSHNVEKAKLRGFKAYIEPQVWAIAGAPAATVIPYNQVKIQGNMYNTTTYQYRIAEPGLYSFTALLYHKANSGDSIPLSVISIYKNGIVEDTIGYRTAGTYNFWHGTTDILCDCGDLVDVRMRLSQVSGVQTAANDALYGYFTGNYEGCNCYNTGYEQREFTF